MNRLILKLFGVKFNGDCSTFDRHVWLAKNLNSTKDNLKLLDVGCGNGWAIFLAAKRGYRAIGLTWSNADKEKILRRAKTLGLVVDVIVHDARQLDQLELGQFDVVVNAENIEHIIDDQKLLSDISHLLVDRGLLYLTAPNFFHRLPGPGENGPFNRGNVEDGWHVRRGYAHNQIDHMMAKCGIVPIREGYITGRLSIALLWSSRLVSNLVFKPVTVPLSVAANLLDRVFFRSYHGSLSVFKIGQKLED